MTRKDYILIAAALKMSRVSNLLANPNRALYLNGIDNAASNIAAKLAQDNPRFDRVKFLAACGVQS